MTEANTATDDSSGMSSEDELRSSDNESLGEPPFRSTATASKKKFTSKPATLLSAFYNTGMKGVGEVYSSRISQAARVVSK